MIVGENARSDDMDVNPTREKKLTNVRSSTGDELERLIPAHIMGLEQALEFCRGDECIEVTPAAVRIRKVVCPAPIGPALALAPRTPEPHLSPELVTGRRCGRADQPCTWRSSGLDRTSFARPGGRPAVRRR